MGVLAARCAFIADSVMGVRAGVEADVAVFGFARLTSARLLQEAGVRVFERLADLPNMLEESSA